MFEHSEERELASWKSEMLGVDDLRDEQRNGLGWRLVLRY